MALLRTLKPLFLNFTLRKTYNNRLLNNESRATFEIIVEKIPDLKGVHRSTSSIADFIDSAKVRTQKGTHYKNGTDWP